MAKRHLGGDIQCFILVQDLSTPPDSNALLQSSNRLLSCRFFRVGSHKLKVLGQITLICISLVIESLGMSKLASLIL